MVIHSAINLGVLLGFAGLLLYAAIEDARRLIIPNAVCLAIAALYPAYVLSAPGAVDWPGALAVGAGTLAVGFVLFSRGFIGGGDAKLMTAASLWAGPALLLPFVFVTSLAGAVVGLIIIALRRYRRAVPAAGDGAAAGPRLRTLDLPYGVAIAVGGLHVALSLLIGG